MLIRENKTYHTKDDYTTNYKGQVLLTAVVEVFVERDIRNKGSILLKQVCVNKEPFRDHTWISVNKYTKHLVGGDTILAFAQIRKYQTDGKDKQSLKNLRSLEINSPRFIDYYKGK